MTEYTSNKEDYQRAMKLSLTGKPENTKSFIEGIATPDFYHVLNGERHDYKVWADRLADTRGQVEEWDPVIESFVRDGDQLAVRMTAVLKMGGKEMSFESFQFSTIDSKSGRIASMVERAVVDGK